MTFTTDLYRAAMMAVAGVATTALLVYVDMVSAVAA